MGLPNSYSTDLPVRCHDLLQLLLPVVLGDGKTTSRHGGALTTTLTIALATPMLTLPIERIQKYLGEEEGYADERIVSEHLAKKIEAAVHGKKLSDHPIFAELNWSFLQHVQPFNVAHGLPQEIAEALKSQDARHSAKELSFTTFLSCVRNGLSHGGIVYLNDQGETSYGEASMLCFVSARQDRTPPKCDNRKGRRCPTVIPKTRDLRLLRISESDFREFLGRWVDWLAHAELTSIAAE